jgi:hypothetical protein
MTEEQRKQMIEDFMTENKGNRDKVRVVQSTEYLKNKHALEQGRALMLWNGSRWQVVPVVE